MLAMPAAAQERTPLPVPGQPTDAPPAEEPARDAFGEVLLPGWNWNAELASHYAYDDNAFGSSTLPLADNLANVNGRISLTKNSRRMQFEVHYAPSFEHYFEYDERDNLGHSFGQSLTYAVSRKTDISWVLNASSSDGGSAQPFAIERVGGQTFQVLLPEALSSDMTVRAASTSFMITRRMTPRQSLTASADFGIARSIREDLGATSLTGLESLGWNYALSADRSIGVVYSHSYTHASTTDSLRDSHSAQLTFAQSFGPRLRMSLGAGPGYSRNHGGEFEASGNMTVFANASLTYLSSRLSMLAEYSRALQPSLLGEQAGSDTVRGSMTRHLTRRLSATATASYMRSQTFDGAGTSNSYLALGSFSYSLTERLTTFVDYTFTRRSGDTSSYFSNFDRNRYSTGFRYTLGRLAEAQ